MKLTHSTRPHFLGSAMNGNKNTNKKNDENQIKNANPNPNREKREKESNRKFLFLYKKLSTVLFQLYKTLTLDAGNRKIQSPFFYGTLYCCCLKTNKMQKLYKTKCLMRKIKPIMTMKEIKSLAKNLELHIHQ